MMVMIIGAIGRRVMDREVRMATRVLVGLLTCHCFMWLMVCGGSVMVAQYASRR